MVYPEWIPNQDPGAKLQAAGDKLQARKEKQ